MTPVPDGSRGELEWIRGGNSAALEVEALKCEGKAGERSGTHGSDIGD
jgi:hypothetical protein